MCVCVCVCVCIIYIPVFPLLEHVCDDPHLLLRGDKLPIIHMVHIHKGRDVKILVKHIVPHWLFFLVCACVCGCGCVLGGGGGGSGGGGVCVIFAFWLRLGVLF